MDLSESGTKTQDLSRESRDILVIILEGNAFALRGEEEAEMLYRGEVAVL